MILGVLSRALAVNFAKMLLTVFVVVLGVAFVIDFFEFSRQAAGVPGYSVGMALMRSALRMPSVMETVIPFVVQFAAVGMLSVLARNQELVVYRGAGLSAYQFIAPVCAIGFVAGLLTIAVIDPIAISSQSMAKALERSIQGVQLATASDQGPLWMARSDGEGLVVIGARSQGRNSLELENVTYLRFGSDGQTAERIDAATASLKDQLLTFQDVVRIDDAHNLRERLSRHMIQSPFTEKAFQGQFQNPNDVAFLELPQAIARAADSGNSENPLKVRLYCMILLPAMLIAVILLSTPISIRFERRRRSAAMMGSTLLLGFALHATTVVTKSLGSAGILAPFIAAAIPVVVASSGGILWLLLVEDG